MGVISPPEIGVMLSRHHLSQQAIQLEPKCCNSDLWADFVLEMVQLELAGIAS